ncbi:MAG: recombinase family protein [Solirubrobacterales bacterium]|nr:recombinase family protein [Solirubrobacterales bacterium]
MGDFLGYARVSTVDQNLDMQLDALNQAGCSRIFSDKVTGTQAERPELTKMLEYARAGDTIVVWKLDRFGRNLKDLLDQVNGLDDRGIGFKSLNDNIDTTSPGGRLVFHVFGAMAQYERDMLSDRTRAGLEAARARGRVGGRKRSFTDEKVAVARDLYDKGTTVASISKTLGVSRGTIYRYLFPGGKNAAK